MKTCANRHCDKPFQPPPDRKRQRVCSPSCGLALATQDRLKKKDKAWRKDPANIPHRKFLKDADEAMAKVVRFLDQGKPCPTCDRSEDEVQNAHGNKASSPWQCGHWLHKTKHQATRFNLKAAARQCAKCNGGSYKHQRKAKIVEDKFREAMILRHGIDEVVRLEEAAKQDKTWTKQELIQIKKKFDLKTKILRDQEKSDD